MSNEEAVKHLSAALKEMGLHLDILNEPAEAHPGQNLPNIVEIHQQHLIINNIHFAPFPSTVFQGECAEQSSSSYNIFVNNHFSGATQSLTCNSSSTIGSLKEKMASVYDMPTEDLRLLHGIRQLSENDKTLLYYNIGEHSMVHLMGRLPGGSVRKIYRAICSSQLFDARFHYDFSKMKSSEKKFERGGQPYQRPCGWYRYAFNVLGKFENDDWLGANKTRQSEMSSVDGEWPISYHGTSYHNGLSIAKEGYQLAKSVREVYGKGIYSTPDLSTAELYAQEYEFDGKIYQIIIQNRINPNNFHIIPGTTTKVGEYWLCPNEKDIRPYAMCIREKPEINN